MNSMNETLKNYAFCSLAAGGAILVPYYGFEVKTAQQLGTPIPRWSPLPALFGGLKAAPKIALIIGTQMSTQDLLEKTLSNENEPPSFSSVIKSSAIVGAVSSPFLAALNGQTMGYSFVEAIKRIQARQIAAISAREVGFLFSLRVSAPFSQWMKAQYDDSRAVELASSFSAGALGSLFGHPFDTALTLWQKDMRVISLRQLSYGGPVKAIATGLFAMLYTEFKKFKP